MRNNEILLIVENQESIDTNKLSLDESNNLQFSYNINDSYNLIINKQIDLVIVDYLSSDNLELIKYIKKTTKFIKIIVLIDESEHDKIIKLIKYNVSNILFKPVGYLSLKHKINKVCEFSRENKKLELKSGFKDDYIKDLLAEVIINTQDAVVVTDKDGAILFVNQKFISQNGYTYDEALGQNPRILKSDKQDELFYKNMWDTINSSKIWEGEFCNKRKDGSEYWEKARIAPIKDADNNVVRFLAIKEDVTQEKILRHKVLNKDALFNTLINSIPDAVCFKDNNEKWMVANSQIVELFGLKEINYKGKTSDELLSISRKNITDDLFECSKTDNIAWENKKQIRFIKEIENDGDLRIYDIIKTPIFTADGSKQGIIVTGRDITDLKRAEDKLSDAKNKAEKSNELKTQFLANVTHEIRTPMNTIEGFAKIVMNDKNISKDSKHYMEIIIKSSNHLLQIFGDILDISKLEANKLTINKECINVNKLLISSKEIHSIKCAEKGIGINFKHTADSDLTINADANRVNQVLNNLIGNAIKFTEKGNVEIGYITNSNSITFYVKDSGKGIPTKDLNLIFDRYAQSENASNIKGTGLGLTISRKLIKLMSGKMWAESEEGKGSCFYFSLPIDKKKYKLTKQAPSKEEPMLPNVKYDWNDKHILLVEDDKNSVLLYKAFLKHTKAKITHADNGKSAIDFAMNNEYDIILMDIQLPIINGLEATAQIRKFNKHTPIIAQTANVLSGDKIKALKQGCNYYLGKPVTKNILLKTINEFIQ